ncbi:MAG: DUF5615 family PIN-like protein [Clostridia bacterium]|jgi:predicted nuclease of predicted toxin-antitoxin system|nr:DUF5615 family PIN-like protein [Clostridia bacterium]MDH7573038.1 DUF5615 family PIN-like protein [Clostridia bacterium]
MRFLADENVDREIVVELRSRSHEVAYVAETEPGISDEELLSQANRKQAVLITADKDFGEIVFRQRRAIAGAILIRLSGLPQEAKARLVASAIDRHLAELAGAFTVVTRNHVRIRKVGAK